MRGSLRNRPAGGRNRRDPLRNYPAIVHRRPECMCVARRCEEEIPQADDFRAVDLERSGGLSQCQQVQGHAKSCQQQELEERASARQDERLQGGWRPVFATGDTLMTMTTALISPHANRFAERPCYWPR